MSDCSWSHGLPPKTVIGGSSPKCKVPQAIFISEVSPQKPLFSKRFTPQFLGQRLQFSYKELFIQENFSRYTKPFQ